MAVKDGRGSMAVSGPTCHLPVNLILLNGAARNYLLVTPLTPPNAAF